MERLGERGNFSIPRGKCNPDVGHIGLEPLTMVDVTGVQEYLDMTGKHHMDIQINIPKFGEQMHNGILNTREMAKAWNWNSDSDELNWRNKSCALRISYDKVKKDFKVQVWNDLMQIWIHLSLTKEDLMKIVEFEKKSCPIQNTDNLYCDKIESKETEHGIEWEYFKDGKVIDTAFMTYKELYLILADKREHKCQFCDSLETERYQPRDEDTAINLCVQHEKYIQRISQKIHGVAEV